MYMVNEDHKDILNHFNIKDKIDVNFLDNNGGTALIHTDTRL